MSTTPNLRIPSRRGHDLAARLDTPLAAPVEATAILAPCFTCGKDLRGLVHISRTLTEHGFGVLRLDVSGVGDSEGVALEAGFAGDVHDLEDAAAWLAATHVAPSLLVGHSLGGIAAIVASQRIPTLHAIATIATPSHARDIRVRIEADPKAFAERLEARARLGTQGTGNLERYFAEVDAAAPLKVLAQHRRPYLVLHAVSDATVGIHHAEALFHAAKDPRKAYLSLGQADHLLTSDADARFAGRLVGAWAASVLEADGVEAATTVRAARPSQREDRITRAITGAGYATGGYAGGHPIRFDEPIKVGGTDTGPTPVEVLRSALAACTTITLRMYADRKGWPLERVECDVTSTSERKDGEVFTHFARHIRLDGDLDSEQRARILEIADRCPVHRSLEGTVTIETVEV